MKKSELVELCQQQYDELEEQRHDIKEYTDQLKWVERCLTIGLYSKEEIAKDINLFFNRMREKNEQ